MQRPALALLALAVAPAFSGCSQDAAPDDQLKLRRPADIPRVVSAEEALRGAHLPAVDPLNMEDAEIGKVLGPGPFCAFRYTSDGKPVLAWKPETDESKAAGVVKVNGLLVPLQRNTSAGSLQFTASEIVLTLTPKDDSEAEREAGSRPRPTELVFDVGEDLRAGYVGYAVCPPELGA